MAGQMHHFEMSVAEIDDVAILNGLDAGSWVDRIGTQVEVRGWYGIDNGAGDFVSRHRWKSQCPYLERIEIRLGQCESAGARTESFKLGTMHQASIEFMMPTDMVDMSMGGDSSG